MRPSVGPTWRPFLGAAILYGVFGVAVQLAFVRVLATHVYAQDVPGNDSLLHVWTLAWGQHALASDPRHALDANIFHPYPRTLLYSDHLLGLAALLAPLRLVTDDVVLVHNLLVLAAPVLNALAMFALVRDLTGGTAAALVGGFIYGFAPLRLHIDRTQVQMLAAWWLPLLLLVGRRTIVAARVRDAVATAVVLVAQGLSGIYLTAFFAPFFVLAHGFWAVRHPPWRNLRGWTLLLGADVLAGVTLLPFAHAYRAVQQSLGTVRSPVLSALLSLGHASPQPSDYVPFAATLLLLAAALVCWRRVPAPLRRDGLFFLLVAGGALLLSFGSVLPLPGRHGRLWGPYGLLMSVPGFTALRAPGRMVHIALLGVSALAAAGFAGAVAGRSSTTRRLATAGVIGLAAFECWTPSFATVPAPPPAVLDPVYVWLAEQPDDVRIVELPLDDFGRAAQMQQYASTAHWHEMLGGNMGILPPAYPYMVRRLREFPALEVLADLRALGITHVVLHAGTLSEARRAQLTARVAAARSWLVPVWTNGSTTVYEIRPDLAPAPLRPTGRLLSREAWRATASLGSQFAHRAIDADPATSWSSWAALEDELHTRWYDPVPFAARWRAFLDAQPAELTIDLGAVHDVSALDVRLAGTDPQALPEVMVEGSLDGTDWRRLPGRLAPTPDVRALVTRANELPMQLLLPQPTALRYLRFSCSGFEWRVGDVQAHGA